MNNRSASNRRSFISANAKKSAMRRITIAAVVVVALLTSLTGVRPLPGGKARAETNTEAESKKLLSMAEAKAMSSGRMSDEEAQAFANFINQAAAADICWKQTRVRGVGTVGTVCPAGTVQEGLLCYKPCPAGYSTSPGGLICGKDCPSGWKTTPLTCYIDADTITKRGIPCPAGWRDDGTACWLDLDVYAKNCFDRSCRAGYTDDGCFCRRPPQRQAKGFEPCPAGYTDFGLTCTRGIQSMNRDTVARGEVKIRDCGPGKVNDAGLCYDACPPRTVGVGPVCWFNCPSTFPENCGAACAKGRAQCAIAVVNMVASTADMALNVAGLLSGAGAAKVAIQKGIQMATKKALTAAARKALLDRAKTMLKNQAKKRGWDMAEELSLIGAEALVSSYEKGEFDWTVLDPIGITAVIEAFNKPIC
jgi:hypothetical protein